MSRRSAFLFHGCNAQYLHTADSSLIYLKRLVGVAKCTLGGYIGRMRDDIKSNVRKKLNRVEGQVRGIAKMIDEDRYCIDVITQIDAVQAALNRVEHDILRDHVSHCVEHMIASGNKTDQRKKVAELMDLLKRVTQ